MTALRDNADNADVPIMIMPIMHNVSHLPQYDIRTGG